MKKRALVHGDEYARFARWYDPLLGGPLASVRAGIAALAEPLAGMAVLDIGCGTGMLLRALDGTGLRCGIDRSPAMLGQARRWCATGCTPICADAGRLPFPDGRFDQVFLSMVLHEMDPGIRGAVWREALRVTSRHGSIIVADYTADAHSAGSTFARWAVHMVERLAGRRHHAAFRDWIAGGGLPGFLRRHGAEIQQSALSLSGQVLIARTGPDTDTQPPIAP